VAFDIDANGIVNVSAQDMATGKEQKITITSSSGLNQDEIDRMQKEAELHEEDDKKKRDLIETKNKADQMCYSMEKTLEEHKDKISAEDRSRVDASIKELREAIGSEDRALMEGKMEALEKEFHKVAEQMYKHVAGPQAGPGAGAPPPGPEAQAKEGSPAGQEGEVIDADFEEANEPSN
jgi:molecular chaperone DnaK